MHALYLFPALITLSTSLSIPNSQTLNLPPHNPSPLIAPHTIENTPWPPAPFHFTLSTTLPLAMTVLGYGVPGPPNPDSTALLKTLSQQMLSGGEGTDKILNHTESAPGIKANFNTGANGVGITRVQAEAVFRRIWGLTIVHGAVGIERCEIEMAGKVVEKFDLEYMFE